MSKKWKKGGRAKPAVRATVPARYKVVTRPAVPPQAPAARPVPEADGRGVSEEQIRQSAYLKWEAAGRPAGDGVAFWLAAERELRGR